MHIRNEPKSLLGEAIGIRLGIRMKVEFTKNTLIQLISEFTQTPPAQNSPSVITRVIR